MRHVAYAGVEYYFACNYMIIIHNKIKLKYTKIRNVHCCNKLLMTLNKFTNVTNSFINNFTYYLDYYLILLTITFSLICIINTTRQQYRF